MSSVTRRVRLTRAAVALAAFTSAAAVPPLRAQMQAGEVTVRRVSDLRGDWLGQAAESPDGRFFAMTSYADDTFQRYDRVTRQWASARGVDLGQQPVWSPNQRFLAYTRSLQNQRYVWILPMDSATGMPSGTPRRISMLAGRFPAWSPDSRRIAFVSSDPGTFRIVSVPFNGGDAEVEFEAPGAGGWVAWSPDGQYLFSSFTAPGQPDSWVRIHLGTRRAEIFPGHARQLIGYSPDGSKVAHVPGPLQGQGSVLYISSSSDGRLLERRQVPSRVSIIGWSRSAPGELTGLEHVVPSHIQRVSVTGGALESLTLPAEEALSGRVYYSSDGRRLAFLRWVDGVRAQVHVMNSDGSNLRAIGEAGDIGSIAWSPNGNQIAYVTGALGKSVHVVDVASGVDRMLVQSRDGIAATGVAVGWKSDGQAVRYVWRPRGGNAPEREAREVSLNGEDRLLARLPPPADDPHFINDTLMLLQKESGIGAVNLRTGDVRPLYTGPIRSRGGFGISKDGVWIGFTAWEGDRSFPMLVSLATGESRRIPYALGGETADVVFHPDGRNLVISTCLTCYTVEKWDVVLLPMNGDAPRVLTASQPAYKDFGAPAISPDGTAVAFEAEQSYNTRIVSLGLPGSP